MFLIEASMPLPIWEFPHLVCFSAAYLRISSFRLPWNYLIDNFDIETVLQLLTWDFPHWGYIVPASQTISSLRLSCDCFPGNFLIGAALGLLTWEVSYWSWWLLTWEFPHWGCLAAVYLRISSLRLLWDWLFENFLIEATCLSKLHFWGLGLDPSTLKRF